MKDTVGLGFLPRRSSGHLDAGVVSPGRRDALARRREFGSSSGVKFGLRLLWFFMAFSYIYMYTTSENIVVYSLFMYFD